MKIRYYLKLIRSIIFSLYFNFHYLPFKQAIRLPILIYKGSFLCLKGKVVIDAPRVKLGMIRLGFHNVGVYPNNGISWENQGSIITFKGNAFIGSDSYLSFGKNSKVVFGDGFVCNAGLKLVSSVGIDFGDNTSLGWGCLIMDTNLHPLYDIEKKEYKNAKGAIVIGPYNWFGTGCKIMHSVKTPERCIFGMNTTVTRNAVMESYCIMGGSPIRILSRNVIRDYENDQLGF